MLFDIDSNIQKRYYKTITIQPCPINIYRKYKIETERCNTKKINYLLNYLLNENTTLEKIGETRKYYLYNKNTVVIDTQLTCISRIPNKKYNLLKPFGEYKNPNENTLSYCNVMETFMINSECKNIEKVIREKKKENEILSNEFKFKKVDSDGNFLEHAENEVHISHATMKEYSRIQDNIRFKNQHKKFKLFAPSLKSIDIMKKINDPKKQKYNPLGYNPLGKNKELYSIVIKNIPQEEDIKNVEITLNKMFRPYGLINKIKILRNRERNNLLGIAFIDFCHKESQIKALEDNTKHSIGYSIISVEKKK